MVMSTMVTFAAMSTVLFCTFSTCSSTDRYELQHVLSQLKQGELAAIIQSLKQTPVYFFDSFDDDFLVEETWFLSRNSSPHWWVTSGAYFSAQDGVARTVQGALDAKDSWARSYARSNARDTSHGARPQNIFRLVSTKKGLNTMQQMYARVRYYEPSESEYRNASNGILLFNRYLDEDTLYYTGIRVDGQAVVKKKYDGTYYTLGSSKIFDGDYHRRTKPNLIPLDTWIGLRSEIATDTNGVVHIKLYTDIGKTGVWTLALDVVDKGTNDPSIEEAGHGGIRTDFMDAEFDDYSFLSL